MAFQRRYVFFSDYVVIVSARLLHSEPRHSRERRHHFRNGLMRFNRTEYGRSCGLISRVIIGLWLCHRLMRRQSQNGEGRLRYYLYVLDERTGIRLPDLEGFPDRCCCSLCETRRRFLRMLTQGETQYLTGSRLGNRSPLPGLV